MALVRKDMLLGAGSKIRLLCCGLAILALVGFAPSRVRSTASPADPSSKACLATPQIAALAASLKTARGTDDSYGAVVQLFFGRAAQSLRAFEENRAFVYASGVATSGQLRRLIIVKPSVVVLEDEMTPGSHDQVCLFSELKPEISAGRVRVREADDEIVWETPPPQTVNYAMTQAGGGYEVKASEPAGAATRFLHLFYIAQKGEARPATRATLAAEEHSWQLTLPVGNRSFSFWLPPTSAGAGEIAISSTDGKVVLSRQPLPSGILPHGVEGNRLLEKWDSDYRGAKPPAWDIGRPADELQKLVNGGTIRKCRAVDLGCGSGTDAIFLASKGFDVTGIDISPTALGQAEKKSREAGVKVRWVLADVTAPPNLGPFDFIYDRGCYHNVRDQNLEAYIETLRRFSHDGTKLLVLSARRDAQSPAGSSGVTEEELRFDFSSLFPVEWLRSIILESNEAGVNAPGWSALLRRETNP
jgi:SAM-dependent methyltransferase